MLAWGGGGRGQRESTGTDNRKLPASNGIRTPDRPAHTELLYRLSYPGTLCECICVRKNAALKSLWILINSLNGVYVKNKLGTYKFDMIFNRASSLICWNKMPTRRNRGFYCRSYCLLNMFRAPLCPSSGAQEYYTVVAACGISCCGFQIVGLVWSWGLCVRFAGCCSILHTGHITLSSTPDQQLENHSTKYHREQPLYNTLELLMMGIVVPETCWASNTICNKNLCCV